MPSAAYEHLQGQEHSLSIVEDFHTQVQAGRDIHVLFDFPVLAAMATIQRLKATAIIILAKAVIHNTATLDWIPACVGRTKTE